MNRGHIVGGQRYKGHVVKALVASIQRYITSPSSAGGMYYLLSSLLTINGDFEAEIEAEIPNTVASNQSLFGGTGGASPAAGTFTIFQAASFPLTISMQAPRAGSSAAYISITLPGAGLQKINFKRVGQTVELSGGGDVSTSSHPGFSTPFEIAYLCRWGSGLHKQGAVTRFKLWINGVKHRTLILDSSMADGAAHKLMVNDAAVIANDIFSVSGLLPEPIATNPTFANDEWVWTFGTTWGQLQFKHKPVSLKPGKSYIISWESPTKQRIALTYNNIATALPNGWVANAYYGSYMDGSPGLNEIVVNIPANANTAGAAIGIGSDSNQNGVFTSIKGFKVREITNSAPLLQRINHNAAATQLYTLNTATTPDQWENADKTKIIPIVGTP